MNRYCIFITSSVLLFSCIGKHKSAAQKAIVKIESSEPVQRATGDTIEINLAKSKVYWKGTKMRGAGKHEGEIKLKFGYLIIKNDQLANGAFEVDMSTIGVTDIPEHEPVPRNNLNKHLKSKDFFNVERFPVSKFQITNVKKITSDSLMISGNLTLKDITNNISFGASYQGKSLKTKFTFDRFQWNIAYKGNWADKTLVDRDIELAIEIEME